MGLSQRRSVMDGATTPSTSSRTARSALNPMRRVDFTYVYEVCCTRGGGKSHDDGACTTWRLAVGGPGSGSEAPVRASAIAACH